MNQYDPNQSSSQTPQQPPAAAFQQPPTMAFQQSYSVAPGQPYSPPPQQPYYQTPGQPYSPPPSQTDGVAIASMVLGIVSLGGIFTGKYVFIGIIAAIVGLILGISARNKRPSGMATAGVVLSSIGLILCLLAFIACVACVGIFGSFMFF